MSTQSAGAYLKELREARGWSLAAVGRRLQTSKSQVVRMEQGDGETRTSLLLSYGRLVGANMRRLIAMMLDEPQQDESFWDEFDALTPEQQQAVINVIRSYGRGK